VASTIDREVVGASTNITVRATSADGSVADTGFTIAVADVNESPVGPVSDGDGVANTVLENAAIGTVVGITASAVDPDATTNAVSYSLSSNPGGLYAIDAVSGVVTVASAIDREVVGPSVDITVLATSADGSSSSQSFSIAIGDVDEFDVSAPVDGNGAADAVTENAAIGTVVGITASASDADATTNAVSYSLSSNPGGLYAIDAVSGVVTVASTIDREVVGASTNITVRATSADGSVADTGFTIAVGDQFVSHVGTPGDDVINYAGSTENVLIAAMDGEDIITGSSFADTIDGGDGHDAIQGGMGGDTINGGLGNDTLGGGEGDDLIDGQGGDDSLAGGLGNDTLLGGLGNDTLVSGGGVDIIDGGADNDAIFINASALLLPATDILGGSGIDSVYIGTGAQLSLSDVLGSMSQVERIDFSASDVSADLSAFNHAAATSLLGASGPGLNLELVLDFDDIFSVSDPVGDGFSYAQAGNIYTFYNSEVLQDATTEIAKVSLV
jgi:Ca2+-binding RTX toxin-like protein